MRSVLLINPKAGHGRAVQAARPVAASLREVTELRTVVASSVADMRTAAERAVAEGADVLAVLGGDGAVHVGVQACAGTTTALAVIPVGTGNDLAHAVGLGSDPLAAASRVADMLRTGQWRSFDLGKIAGGGWFATVLCAGFDSKVNARANRLPWPRGRTRYDVAILRELLGLHAMPLRIDIGDDVIEMDATMVAVGNTSSYGGGVPVCPGADPQDGAFTVTALGKVSRRELVEILMSARTGEHVEHPAVRMFQARSVRLSGDNGWFAYADGEPQVRLPASVQCERAALRLVAGGDTE